MIVNNKLYCNNCFQNVKGLIRIILVGYPDSIDICSECNHLTLHQFIKLANTTTTTARKLKEHINQPRLIDV